MRRSVVFPNASRSYDATRVAVRFWGYDQSMEIPFFIGAEVLGSVQPAMSPEPEGYLSAFDAHRARICAVAARVYERRRSAPTISSPAIFDGVTGSLAETSMERRRGPRLALFRPVYPTLPSTASARQHHHIDGVCDTGNMPT